MQQADAGGWLPAPVGSRSGCLRRARPSCSDARFHRAQPARDGGVAVRRWCGAELRAQAALEQTRIGYESGLLGALQQVEDALAALGGDRERLARLQAAAEAAANADLLARQQRYASGLIDFRTVLDTQRTCCRRRAISNPPAPRSAPTMRLYLALGGGWSPDAVTPSESR